MPQPKRPLKVFLCHAHADRDAVRALYMRLTDDGVDAWLDKEKLLPGQDWELEIKKAVREADAVVVCLSRRFNQAGFRQKEVRYALDIAMEKPDGVIYIVPAKIEECEIIESLKRLHCVSLFEPNGYTALLKAVEFQSIKKQISSNIEYDLQQLERKEIISFHSKNEDSGKLSVIANLAAQMAVAGKRVGVVDMDFQSSGFYIHFGLDENVVNRTMVDFLRGEAAIHDVGIPVHASVSNKVGLSKLKNTQLWLFPSTLEENKNNIILTEGLNLSKVPEGLRETLKEYDLDYILVNSGELSGEAALLTIAMSDTAVLVSRPSNRDLQKIDTIVDFAKQLSVPRLYIVLNKVPDKYDISHIEQEVQKALGVLVISSLPISQDLESDMFEDIYSLCYPDEIWSRYVHNISKILSAKE